MWRSSFSHDVTMLHNCTLLYTFVAYTFPNHQVINQSKNLSWPINGKAVSMDWKFLNQGISSSKVSFLNWLILQYRKTITAEFFFKAYTTSYRNHIFMEIVAIAKFAEIFETAFLEKHARVSSFSQPEKI